MGKSKKGSSKASAVTAKCTCDHPFQCMCGNRPERPSKGHKWDAETQQWGGKGHKQKGASGQTASVAKMGAAAVTTSTGGTRIEGWQRLPSTILQEYCQKQKRPRPKYKNISNKSQEYKYRVILNDPKGDDKKDLFFVPPIAVANEEQAMQEACLLALLHLTPKIPHERKLPEPYRQTWLHAMESLKKESQQSSKEKQSSSSSSKQQQSTNNSSNGKEVDKKKPAAVVTEASSSTQKKNDNTAAGTTTARASTNLVAAVSQISSRGTLLVVSRAQKEQAALERKRARNAKIARHEAKRLANQNHHVFMGNKMRKRIETLLRGSSSSSGTAVTDDDDSDDDEMNDDEDDMSAVQALVQKRLHDEGFTRRQARKAFEEQMSRRSNKSRADLDNLSEDLWDDVYEQCLQWLLIHVNEEDLPAGLDPRERTLDVIAPTTNSATRTNNNNINNNKTEASTMPTQSSSKSTSTGSTNPMVTQFAARHALSIQDAALIHSDAEASLLRKDMSNNNDKIEIMTNLQEECFWKRIVAMADVSLVSETGKEDKDNEANGLFQDECEALEAIFPDECTFQNDAPTQGTTTITVTVHVEESSGLAVFGSDNDKLELQIVVENGKYPTSAWPRRVLLSSTSNNSRPKRAMGVALQVEMARFVAALPLGEAMMFRIHGEVNALLESVAEMPTVPSLSNVPSAQQQKPSNDKKTGTSRGGSSKPKVSKTRTMQQQPSQRRQHRQHRQRLKSPFWSKTPQKTPAAVAFPSIVGSLKRARQSLPAATARSDFLQGLEKANRGGHVLLCTGDTGCGKTTQIPQFILEEYPKDAKIVVCQPRRLAATGVAARVAEERGEDQPGKKSVGYVVRGDSALCDQSRLVFCTTGVLLRQLQSDGALDCLTHIVVDEVHERNLDTDILLALLKQILPSAPHIRVILMSATLDADRFAAYWGKATPRIHIPGRTFPVQDYMLEDVLSITGYIPSKKGKGRRGFGSQNRPRNSTPWADSEASDEEQELEEEQASAEATDTNGGGGSSHGIPIEELVDRVDETKIDYDLLARLVKHLIVNKDPADDGSVLVFLPGAPEINQAMETIKKVARDLPLRVLPLHGGLQPKDQNLVFKPAGGGLHKVILSTNVAETSVTIPDCTVVIDSAREKQSSYDPSNRMPLLVEKFCSKASLKQRRGRAGRVREGTCYKLISAKTHSKLSEHGEPEIRRSALDQTLLSLLFLGMDCNPSEGGFLDSLLDPPSKASLRAAIFSLEKLGAVNFDRQSDDVSLTPLGMHLAGIPAAPIVGKILVLGSILGCRQAGVAMAAGLSIGRSPLLRVDTPRRGARKDSDEPASPEEMKQQNIRRARAELFESVGGSDHAFLAALFLQWKECGNGHERKRYCDSLGLSFMGMREMLQLANQLDNALQSIGYLDTPEANRNGKYWTIIRAVAVAGMAPGQLVKVVRPATTYQETAEGAKEKDGEARDLKFFVRTDGPDSGNNNAASTPPASTNGGGRFANEERVFIHPSSANFSTGSYSVPWLVYHSLVRTSKAFLRDVTECNAYTLLLFGGKLDVVASKEVAVLDNWCQLGANPRIGALMAGLRLKVDDLLAKKVLDPTFDLAATEEMKLIVQLIATDGLGT